VSRLCMVGGKRPGIRGKGSVEKRLRFCAYTVQDSIGVLAHLVYKYLVSCPLSILFHLLSSQGRRRLPR